jgi:hypothetical protein
VVLSDFNKTGDDGLLATAGGHDKTSCLTIVPIRSNEVALQLFLKPLDINVDGF